MIDVKQAVKSAESYARDLYSDADLRHLGLEEVEREDSRWKATLGWVEPAVSGMVLAGDLGKLPRLYKLFEVDADTGEVTSMKIRAVE
ncbi:MAG TPA: hypothetical protein VEX86_24405 [Longimicrobium sp.]|nr:hypothetical protein [Longimicrobium sp.]